MILRRLAPVILPCLLLRAGEVREQILVVVNDHIITQRTFQQAVEQGTAALYRENSGQQLDAKLHDAREKVLQGMVDSFLIADKARDLGVTVNDDQTRAYVDEVKKQNNFTSDDDFERALRSELGIGLQTYLERSKADMVKQEVLRRDVFSKMIIEDQELLAYYQEHKVDYRLPGRFRIRELVLPRGATDAERADTRAKLAEIRTAIHAGTPFADLVQKYSTAPSRDTGGDLGWLNKGVLRMDLEETSLSLQPGQISAPVWGERDVSVIQLLEMDMFSYKPFEEVRQAIRDKLQEPRAESAIESYLQGLRIRANIRYMVPRDTILKG
jgi:peptidyl-prolyl cis-trans isomerase SurA